MYVIGVTEYGNADGASGYLFGGTAEHRVQ